MIAIIDYGVGNLRNVYKALEKMGVEAVITSEEKDVDIASGIILPGVGAYRDAMDKLRASGLIPCIKKNVSQGKPILGICLGMQLLFERSFEDGDYEGLGLLKGDIVRFQESELKVPHMGWNTIRRLREDEIGSGVEDGEYVYFVHSYYLKPGNKEDVVFVCDYGTEVPAVVRRGNITGMQFHPEKSGATGERLLRNFIEIIG